MAGSVTEAVPPLLGGVCVSQGELPGGRGEAELKRKAHRMAHRMGAPFRFGNASPVGLEAGHRPTC